MQENVEISNPMYQSQDLEEEAEGLGRDFTIDTDRVSLSNLISSSSLLVVHLF